MMEQHRRRSCGRRPARPECCRPRRRSARGSRPCARAARRSAPRSGRSEALFADVVPVFVARADQLREILVARHERDVLARRAHARRQRADDVVGFVLAAGEAGDAERLAQVAAQDELRASDLPAPARDSPCTRETAGCETKSTSVASNATAMCSGRTRSMRSPRKRAEAVQRVDGIAVGIDERDRDGVVGAQDENRGVDQVEHAAASLTRRRADSLNGVRLQPRVQRTGAREMRQQVFHLVGEHAPALEVDVLGVGRLERHRDAAAAPPAPASSTPSGCCSGGRPSRRSSTCRGRPG